MRRGALALLCGLGLASCGLVPAASGPSARGELSAVPGKPDGERWLAKDTSRARAAGASPSEIIAVDAGAPGDRVAGLVSVPEDTCVLLLARASDGVDDIDLFAFGDDGALLGSDERPDKSPAVLICPPHPKRLYVLARVAAGHGIVAVAGQRVAPRDAPAVGRVLAARQARGGSDPWAGLDAAVSAHHRGIGGTWQEIRRVATPVDAGIPTRISALIEAERCMDVLVVPGDDVSHLDVAALEESGRVVARAVARGRERFLLLCSPEKLPVTIELRPQSGRGYAAVVLSQSRDASLPAVEARLPVQHLGPVVPIAEAREKLEAYLDGQGYAATKKLGEGMLTVGRRESLHVDLVEGCSRIDVIGGKPLRGIEAWLWSASDSLLAHARGSGSATLFACGSSSSSRLDFEALAHTGAYAIELRHKKDVPRALVDHPLAAGRLLSRMEGRGIARRIDHVGAPRVVPLGAAQRGSLDIVVPIGRCVDVALALGPGASGAEVRLVDAGTSAELDLGSGTVSAGARACALDRPSGLRVRAELRAVTGASDALVATRMLAPVK